MKEVVPKMAPEKLTSSKDGAREAHELDPNEVETVGQGWQKRKL